MFYIAEHYSMMISVLCQQQILIGSIGFAAD
jgi:hypothetical protein